MDVHHDVIYAPHGGVTFSSACRGMNPDGSGICHPADEGDHVWWFGFDAIHLGDQAPSHRTIRGEYRTQFYMEKECADLARELAKRA